MEGQTGLKIALQLMHPSPYRDIVASKLQGSKAFELDIAYLFSEDYGHANNGLGKTVDAIAGDSRTLYPKGFLAFRLMWRLLKRFVFGDKYDLVIWTAYAPWWITLPIVARAAFGKNFAIAIDTVSDDCGWLAHRIKHFVLSRAKFLWVPGEASKRFLTDNYRIDSGNIEYGVYSCEFNCERANHENFPVFLMVANNTPFRRMDVVVDGFKTYRSNGGLGTLILCGKGVKCFSSDRIECFDGGVEWTKLPELYARADVYVHNGTEQFSVATLMGAMAGLPILCGAKVGVASDLFGKIEVGHAVNDWESSDAWAEAFDKMLQSRSHWQEMGDNAKSVASKFNPDDIVSHMIERLMSLAQ